MNTKTTIKLLIFIGLSLQFLTFSACKNIKECPAFSDSDLKYIPYQEIDTLRYKNQENEIYDIYINSFYKSESYNYECNDLNNICNCTDYIEIKATDSKNNNEFILLKMEQFDNSNPQIFRYQILDLNFEFDFINDLPNIQYMENIDFKDTITIGNKLYSDVLIVRNMDNATSAILNVYFNKNEGILKFTEKTNGKEWDLTEY
jgi:hypothetical protein